MIAFNRRERFLQEEEGEEECEETTVAEPDFIEQYQQHDEQDQEKDYISRDKNSNTASSVTSAQYRENKIIRALCVNNNISESQFISKRDKITAIEMCHFNFPRIEFMDLFSKSLTSLCLVAQDIKVISGLDMCTQLESLWICETKVSKIEGLDSCTKLVNLYLYSNKIKQMEGLGALKRLRKLWLFDNEISKIENVSCLRHLEDLQLANNKISIIGDSLIHNHELSTLNVAGNLLYSFQDVLSLAKLPNLVALTLNDPTYAENPICALTNYQTHLIYNMRNLERIDALEVTEDARKAIITTVMKKRMYYNMRIRVIKRNKGFLLGRIGAKVGDKYDKIQAECENIHGRVKVLKRHYDDIKSQSTSTRSENEPKMLEDLEETIQKLKEILAKKMAVLKTLSHAQLELKRYFEYKNELTTRQLLLELETCGNLRFDEMSATESSWNEVENIMNSLSSATQTIQVHSISKINNRLLQHLFEKKYQNGVAENNDYLCYTISNADELFDVAEYGAMGTLSKNSEKYAFDPSRLTPDLSKISSSSGGPFIGAFYKVVLLRYYKPQPKKVNKKSAVESTPPTLSSSGAEEINLDIDLEHLVPMFIVEFSCTKPSSTASNTNEKEVTFDSFILNITKHGRLTDPDMISKVNSLLTNLEMGTNDKSTGTIVNEMSIEKKLEDMFPLKARQVLTTKYLTSSSYENIEYLNLTRSQLEKFNDFTNITALKHLILSHNDIRSLSASDLASYPNLETLDVSFNMIRHISGNGNLRNLRTLDISKNSISTWEALGSIAEKMNGLTSLDFRFNPISTRKGHRVYALQKLPQLLNLNGLPRQDIPEKSLVARQANLGNLISATNLTILELDGCNLWDLSLLPETLTQLRTISARNNGIIDVSPLSRFENLEELYLDNNNINTVDALSSLSKLTKLDVSNNFLTSINALSGLNNLIVLAADNNKLRNLHGVLQMPNIMELYVGNNSIADLHNVLVLKEMPKLAILDLMGNPISFITEYRLFIVFHLGKIKIVDGCAITLKEIATARETFFGKLTIELLGEKLGHYNFQQIQELDLRDCRIKDIECFQANAAQFRALRKLNLDNNLLTCIDPLIYLTNIRFLSLNNNRLDKLFSSDLLTTFSKYEETKNQSFFPVIEELQIGGNVITRLSDLALFKLPSLQILRAPGNKLTRIDGLNGLVDLKELNLDKNMIKGAEPASFESLEKLEVLHMKENRVKSLANFECLTNLQYLFLSNNKISDLTDVDKTDLPRLAEISLMHNPITKKSAYRPTLINHFFNVKVIDGRVVEEEERKEAENAFMEFSAPPSLDPVTFGQLIGASQTSLNGKTPIKISNLMFDGKKGVMDFF